MATIRPLKEYPDYAPILAFWAYREWYTERDIEFDLVVEAYKSRINNTSLPFSYVAIEDGIPVGMCTLKLNDLWSRKDINPWLASLFVIKEYRNRGIGNLLINKIKEEASAIGYGTIYLFTESGNKKNCNYYSKRSWQLLGTAIGNDEKKVSIYFFKI